MLKEKTVRKIIKKKIVRKIKRKDSKKDNKEKDSKKDNKEKDSKKDNKMVPADKDKLNSINEAIKKLQKLKIEIQNKIQPINNSINKLLRDLQLRLVELDKMDIEINDLINVAWREIYEKKRRGQQNISINKIKDTEEYVNELRYILTSKITMLKTFCSKIDSPNSDAKDRINKNDAGDSLIKIIEYMELYRKRLKTNFNLRLISD